MSKRKWNNQDLVDAVKNSEHITDVVKTLGLKHSSLNADTVRKYIKELELDTSHWKDQIIRNRRTGYERNINEVFVENSTYTKSHLRDKIIKYQLLEYQCAKCGIDGNWNGEPLVLQVDHINGINTDHRIENLRFLCPNCHSQTITYAGANAKKRKDGILNKCQYCGNYCSYNSEQQCIKCYHKNNPRFNWPSNVELTNLLKTKSAFQISKDLKVSPPALYKHFKKNGIDY